MRYAGIRTHEGQYPLVLMCRVLEVARAGYYAWRRRGLSARVRAEVPLRLAIRAVHAASQGRYGRPRVYRALQQQAWPCGQHRVGRLMRLEGLRGTRPRPYRTTTQADGTPPAPNRLQRQFHVPQLNQVWASDVTALPTASGWLYLAVVLDLASRRVIGWHAGPTPGQDLTLPALQRALADRCPPRGLVHHSDRGSHYTGTMYQQVLAQHGVAVSMSRRGDCWDNAVVESFFATLKTELRPARRWSSRADAHAALRAYIRWYNGQRLHSTLGYVSPAVFERQLTAA